MTVSVQFLWFAIVLVGFTVGFIAYWIGTDRGSRETFFYKQLYQDERSRRILAEQREAETTYPRSVWNNYSSSPDKSPN